MCSAWGGAWSTAGSSVSVQRSHRDAGAGVDQAHRESRMSDTYIQTHGGGKFDFVWPDQDAINIEDIAEALSKICRYTGHCKGFYSVAQHSLHCAEMVAEEFALEALLHDASEAYCNDISRPLKTLLPDYRFIEARVDAAIRGKFGLPSVESKEVKIADQRMLLTEQRSLMGGDQWTGHGLRGYRPYERWIVGWDWESAREEFLGMYHFLTNERPIRPAHD